MCDRFMTHGQGKKVNQGAVGQSLWVVVGTTGRTPGSIIIMRPFTSTAEGSRFGQFGIRHKASSAVGLTHVLKTDGTAQVLFRSYDSMGEGEETNEKAELILVGFIIKGEENDDICPVGWG